MEVLRNFAIEEITKLEKLHKEQVEVYGDTIEDCLRLAAKHLSKQVHDLDYIVLKRGKKKFLFPEPFHIRVFPVSEEEKLQTLAELDKALTGGSGKLVSKELKELVKPKDSDGFLCIKNFRSGVYISVHPPTGNGKPVKIEDVNKKLAMKGIQHPIDQKKIEEIVEDISGELVRVSEAKIKPFMEGLIKVEISNDKMRASVTLIPPKPGGRDIEVSDVVYELKKEDIQYGIKEDSIKKYIDEDRYNEPFFAAEGDFPANGKNAQIVYHVRTDKKIKLKEDSSGKIDYRDLDLIENVVVGQLLAEKLPAEKGKYGRSLFNEIIEAKDGQDVQLAQGKGTILSEDKTKLTAEVNGQVIYMDGKISVETVYRVNGDVGMKTGNITFLGSVVVTGNVEDNYHIKASGNVEIYGTVQKSSIEADGDIIIRQGVTGRGDAKIESTGGNIVSKFIQDATVITDKDVVVNEGVINSIIHAGGKIVSKGKKGHIVGGSMRAGQIVDTKVIGSSANVYTEVVVGVNPKILRQIDDYTAKKSESQGKLDQLKKSLNTLKARKESNPEYFTEEYKQYYQKLEAGIKKLEKRLTEYDKEIQTLVSYMEQTSERGRILVEKVVYAGVRITINGVEMDRLRNDMKSCVIFVDNEQIRYKPYIDPEADKSDWRRGRTKTKSTTTAQQPATDGKQPTAIIN